MVSMRCGPGAAPESARLLSIRRGGGLVILVAVVLLLAACTPSVAPLTDTAWRAEATACACNCFPYGSYQMQALTPTPTPTGTWTPPTPTPRPSPTSRPAQTPCDEPPCPAPIPPATAAPAWPPPLITCTAAAGQATLTPEPSPTIQWWPPREVQPPLPAIVGNTDPLQIGAGLGIGRVGDVTLAPRTGRPWLIYSLFNSERGQEASGRVYVKTVDARTGTWGPATTVSAPGNYAMGRIGADDAVHVLYPERTSPDPGDPVAMDYRTSTDQGHTWSPVAAFPGAEGDRPTSLRLAVDPNGAVHAAWATNPNDVMPWPGLIHYFEQLPDGSWRQDVPPRRGRGVRQYAIDLAFVPLPGGIIRTVLAWIEDDAVYTTSKDGPTGAWAPATLLIDGGAQPYGIPDYVPSLGGRLRTLSFTDADGTSWVYVWWALYSTGRICFAYSPDGGRTWLPNTPDRGTIWHEDTMAYYNRFQAPTPGPGEASRGTVHAPTPFWDSVHQRIIVIYSYTDRRPGGAGDTFPAYAYGRPGAPGASWTGYATFTTQPLRLFKTTFSALAGNFTGTTLPGAGGLMWFFWTEANGVDELYVAGVAPGTLISDGNVLP